MRRATVAYAAVAALLIVGASIDVCLCERLGCPGLAEEHRDIAEKAPDRCCEVADPARNCANRHCCERFVLEAIAPPKPPTTPEDVPGSAPLPIAESAVPDRTYEQHLRVRDGPQKPSSAPEVRQRPARAPPLLAA